MSEEFNSIERKIVKQVHLLNTKRIEMKTIRILRIDSFIVSVRLLK